MLLDTLIIFSVLLGLMILISVLGGSIVSVENFADEVMIDESYSTPSSLPSPSTPQMTPNELQSMADSLAAMPSADDRKKAMQPIATETQQVLKTMLRGMGVDLGEGDTSSPSPSVSKPDSQERSEPKTSSPPVATEGKSASSVPAEPPKAPSSPEETKTSEGFTRGMEKFSPGPQKAKRSPQAPVISQVEPFDGNMYAAF